MGAGVRAATAAASCAVLLPEPGMQTPMVRGQGSNRGSSSLLSRVRRTLMSVPSLGWDSGCVLGPWVSGKHSPWKRRAGEDQCPGRSGGRLKLGQGISMPKAPSLSHSALQKWGLGLLSLEQPHPAPLQDTTITPGRRQEFWGGTWTRQGCTPTADKAPAFIHPISGHPLAMDQCQVLGKNCLSIFTLHLHSRGLLSRPAGTLHISPPHTGQCPVNY